MTSYRVVSYDNGYGKSEGSGLSLEKAEALASSVAGLAFGGRDEAPKYRDKHSKLPRWGGHGFKVEVVADEPSAVPFGLDGDAQRREAAEREAAVQQRRAPHHGGAPENTSASSGTSVYRDMVAAGVKTDSHESDLYVEATPEARAVLARHPIHEQNAKTFQHAETGKLWLDIPFAFEPFWRKKPR